MSTIRKAPDDVPDRAAIEALARELSDYDWQLHFDDLERFGVAALPEKHRALLAYLDEVVAEADKQLGKPGHQEWLRSLPEPMRKAAIRWAKELK